ARIKSAKPLPRNPNGPRTVAMLMPTIKAAVNPTMIAFDRPARSDRAGATIGTITSFSGSGSAGGDGVLRSVIGGPSNTDATCEPGLVPEARRGRPAWHA